MDWWMAAAGILAGGGLLAAGYRAGARRDGTAGRRPRESRKTKDAGPKSAGAEWRRHRKRPAGGGGRPCDTAAPWADFLRYDGDGEDTAQRGKCE